MEIARRSPQFLSERASRDLSPYNGRVLTGEDLAEIHRVFAAPIAALDCGTKCASLNGGVPFCCDGSQVVPVLWDVELALLRERTDMWRAVDRREERRLGLERPDGQRFARCRGHERCEREHRALSCRSFPFYPYFADGDFFGLGYHWEWAGRCWVLERTELVLPEFVSGFVRAWEIVFERDPAEADFFRKLSARARAAHTRLGRILVVIDRDGRAWRRRPGAKELEPA
jgi:hypothetical protein